MSIGATLHAARQEAGLSIDDVAVATRIRGTLIRAIESDNFEPCGGSTYARGHIKNIAVAVGLDPEPLLAQFNQTQAIEPVRAHQVLDRPEIVQRDRTGPNWTAAMLVTAVLLAGVALVGLLTGPDGATPSTAAGASTSAPAAAAPEPDTSAETLPPEASEPQAGETQAAETQAVEPAAPQSSAPAAAATSAPAPPTSAAPVTPSPAPVVAFNGVRVKVSVTGARCWVRATDLSSGKKVLYQGVLERGEVRDFTATSKISVTFGDAGAVTLKVNGRDIGSPGGPGKVVTVPFVPGDPGAG